MVLSHDQPGVTTGVGEIRGRRSVCGGTKIIGTSLDAKDSRFHIGLI